MKIVILDSYTAVSTGLSLDNLRDFTDDVTIYDRTLPDDAAARIGDAEIVLMNRTVLSYDTIMKCKNLRYIGAFATGYNTIDLAACRERGIVVANVPGYSSPSVAQLVFSFMLHFAFLTPLHDKAVHNGEWRENDTFCYYDPRIFELKGKTLGIVGFGSTAGEVYRIAKAFEMNILIYSRTKYPEYEDETARFVSFDEMLEKSDIITLHIPLFPETRELINEKAIAKMKDGAIVINTARGPIVDESAVAAALNSGKLSGYGADVVSIEPISPQNPLLTAKNCVLTPHIAWSTHQARERLIDVVYSNIKAFLDGNPQNNVAK